MGQEQITIPIYEISYLPSQYELLLHHLGWWIPNLPTGSWHQLCLGRPKPRRGNECPGERFGAYQVRSAQYTPHMMGERSGMDCFDTIIGEGRLLMIFHPPRLEEVLQYCFICAALSTQHPNGCASTQADLRRRFFRPAVVRSFSRERTMIRSKEIIELRPSKWIKRISKRYKRIFDIH